MSTAILPFNIIQIGKEVTKGTLVAATKKLIGEGNWTEEQDFYRSAYPRQKRATVGGAGVIVRKGSMLEFNGELNAEEILWPLSLGIRGGVSPTQGSASGTSDAGVVFTATTLTDPRASLVVNGLVGGTVTADGKTGTVTSNTATVITVGSWSGGTPSDGVAWSCTSLDYTWVFTPELGTEPTLNAATIEFAHGDGTTNHYYGEAGYCLCSEISAEWAFNQVAKMGFKVFGRARQSDTITAALSPYSTREELVSPLLKVYADTSWSGLGGTQLQTTVRSAKLTVATGNEPDYTLDGRSDLDLAQHKWGALGAKLDLVLEFNSTGLAQSFTKYRSNSLTYIRLKQTGNAVGQLNKMVQVDGAFRFVSAPSFSVDGQQVLVTCSLEAVYDATGTKIIEFTAVNGLSAL